MKRLIGLFVMFVPLSFGANALTDGRIAHVEDRSMCHKLMLSSALFMVAGQMLDFQSSIGGHELNGLIGNGRNGTFNVGRGLAVKGIVIGTALGIEWAMHRANGHNTDKLATGINAGLGSLGMAAAVHNWSAK